MDPTSAFGILAAVLCDRLWEVGEEGLEGRFG